MSGLLRVGSSGQTVVQLKERLRALRYAVDRGATFTEATHHAVMAFQKVNGLDRDGVAGAKTLTKLQLPQGVRLGRGEQHRIVVDLSDQVLMVVDHGRVRKNGGIAVHGAPRVLATPASHGCVRIPMHLAASIQDAMRAGVQVQVRR